MKKVIILAVFIIMFCVLAGVIHAAPLDGVRGRAPSIAPEATNTLLSAVTSTGTGTAVNLGMTTSKNMCIVRIGGEIPTNVVVKLEGSTDNTYWYDLATHTFTPVEMIANGTFTGNATGWTEGSGWAYSANTEPKSGAGVAALSQALADMTIGFVKGQTYLLNYDVTFSVTTGGLTPSMCGVTGTNVAANTTNAAQVFTCAAATGDLSFTPGNTAMRGVLDNVTMVRGEDGFAVVDKPARFIRGYYVSKSGGGATTSVTMSCTSGGQ